MENSDTDEDLGVPPDYDPEPLDRRSPRGFMVLTRAAQSDYAHGKPALLRASEIASVSEFTVHDGTRFAREGSEVSMRNGHYVIAHEPPGEVAALMNREGEGRPPLAPPEPETVGTLLGLPSVLVDPDCRHALQTRPQLVARIRSILVDYATADAFSLCGVRVGKREVSAISAEPVPLSMMGVEVADWPRAMEIGGEQEGGLDLWKDGRSFSVVQIMQDVTVMVHNTSTRPALFRGVLRVDVLREPPDPGGPL